DPLAGWGTPRRALHALRRLAEVGPVLARWAGAAGPRRVLRAAPGSSCAGMEHADLALVAGPSTSSESRRLVETARRAGTDAHLVEDVSDLDLDRLAGASVVGVTAGTSAPPALVDDLLAALGGLGPLDVTEHRVTTEPIHVPLPEEVS
ncbi:MAG TPA: 4-hydroxy-3-methylbut-2-enyl diphosphate reductase, partial [Pseudonocardia sp.]|nr:4-hydroxy-3-methylbut-2-enyl diphosphate reductase [Pseudonocardia sp.]